MRRLLLPLGLLACATLALVPLRPALAQVRPVLTQVRPAQTIEVRILPQAEVFGREFTLGEIAEMDSFDLAVLKRLSVVRIGTSPLPGRSLHLSRSLIRSRLEASGVAPSISLHVPADAKVVRAGQRISGKTIGEIVLAHAEKDSNPGGQDELRQEIPNTPEDALLPKGNLRWEVKLVGSHLLRGGTRMYDVRAIVDNEEAWKSTVRVRQKIYREVVVASRPIRRNHKITKADLTLLRKNISDNRADPYLTSLSEVVGRLAKRPVGKQESLHAGMLLKPADVSEGGRVTVVFQSGSLVLTAPGVAMVQGRAGQFIPVRNLETGRIVHGILQGDETVKVN